MTIKNRLDDLERAAGMTGAGCMACAGRDVYRPHYPGEARPSAVNCAACGRDLLNVITVEYVTAAGRAPLTADESEAP